MKINSSGFFYVENFLYIYTIIKTITFIAMEILKIDNATDKNVLYNAINAFDKAVKNALGSKYSYEKYVSFIVSLGQNNAILCNNINAKLELELRAAEIKLAEDDNVTNVRRYYKENWGTKILFDYKNRTIMLSSYDVDNNKFECYKHDENSYSLNRAIYKQK